MLVLEQIYRDETSSFILTNVKCENGQIVQPLKEDIVNDITALANTDGGVIILDGISQQDADIVVKWIDDICSSSTSHPLSYTVQPFVFFTATGNRYIIKVIIDKGERIYKSLNGYFYREGTKTEEMTAESLIELAMKHGQKWYG